MNRFVVVVAAAVVVAVVVVVAVAGVVVVVVDCYSVETNLQGTCCTESPRLTTVVAVANQKEPRLLEGFGRRNAQLDWIHQRKTLPTDVDFLWFVVPEDRDYMDDDTGHEPA